MICCWSFFYSITANINIGGSFYRLIPTGHCYQACISCISRHSPFQHTTLEILSSSSPIFNNATNKKNTPWNPCSSVPRPLIFYPWRQVETGARPSISGAPRVETGNQEPRTGVRRPVSVRETRSLNGANLTSSSVELELLYGGKHLYHKVKASKRHNA